MRWLALVVLVACNRGDAWSTFRGDRFSVDMPGAPVEGTAKTATLPKPTETHTFLVSRGARGSFQVAYYELSLALGADAIESAEKLDCMSSANGKWTSIGEHPIAAGSAAGYAVQTRADKSDTLPDGGYAEDRCFVVGQRMYHLISVGPDTPEQRREAARFLDSFRPL